MKLFLSSYNFGLYPNELLKLLPEKPTAGVIANAKDYNDEPTRLAKVTDAMQQLSSIGIEGEEIDLRHYFDNHSGLERVLTKHPLLWVTGGNVFLLRKALAYSGADILLPSLIRESKIVYGGFSAGICVLTPTLHGIERCDPVDQSARGYKATPIWDGLAVVTYAIAPHYQSAHYEYELIDQVVEYYKAQHIAYKTLHDGEVIIIDGETERLLTV